MTDQSLTDSSKIQEYAIKDMEKLFKIDKDVDKLYDKMICSLTNREITTEDLPIITKILSIQQTKLDNMKFFINLSTKIKELERTNTRSKVLY
jgi:hypothetical protein